MDDTIILKVAEESHHMTQSKGDKGADKSANFFL